MMTVLINARDIHSISTVNVIASPLLLLPPRHINNAPYKDISQRAGP